MWWKDLVKILGPCEYTVENYAKAIEKVYEAWVKCGSYKEVASLYGISENTARHLVDCAMNKTPRLLSGFSCPIKPGLLVKITGSSAITKENEEKAIRRVYDLYLECGSFKEVGRRLGLRAELVARILDYGENCKVIPKIEKIIIKPEHLAKITGSSEITKENEEKAIMKLYDLYLEFGTFKKVSERLGLKATLVSRILDYGKNKKLIPNLEKRQAELPDKSLLKLSNDKKEKILMIRRLYDELGTLEAVAQRVGLTRQRVHQILLDGKIFGLFKNVP